MVAKPYKVLKIDEMSRMAETGGVEKFYRHQIKTNGGMVQTVDIDKEDFTPEKVAPILTAVAKNADAILSL